MLRSIVPMQTKECANIMSKRVVVEIPEDLHRNFKAFCSRNGTKITKEVRDFICGLLESEEDMLKDEATKTPGRKDKNSAAVEESQVKSEAEKPFDLDAFRKGLGLKPKKEKVEQDLSLETYLSTLRSDGNA